MSEPTPITPDSSAAPARHGSRGFWRRDMLIWGAVLLALAGLATWRLSTSGRGPQDADAMYPADIGLRSADAPAPVLTPAEARPTLPAPPQPTGNP